MGSVPDQAAQRQQQPLTARTIHDLLAPLTVIKAQAQMVQRWVHRSDLPDAEAVLARLAVIDAMVTRLVADLDERSHVVPPDRAGDAAAEHRQPSSADGPSSG